MNHTFTTKTWGGNKSVSDAILIPVAIISVLLIITIIGAPIGFIIGTLPLTEYVINIKMTCPSCNAKVSVFRNAKAFSCYNCQTVFAKKNNQWQEVIENK